MQKNSATTANESPGRSYDAFVSYRHLPGQKELAIELQERLERYTIRDPTTGKKRRLLVFRDESELPVSEDLSQDIVDALTNSRFLIVIASTTYEESKWCMKEVNEFRAMHNNTNRHIIPVLFEGEPDESVPSVLRQEERDGFAADGTPVTIIEEVEPLAADVRGETPKEQLKKLRKTECMRVAARILGVPYDSLYRRHLRQTIAKVATIAAIAIAVVTVFVVSGLVAQQRIEQERVAKQAKETLRLLEVADAESDPTLAMMVAEKAYDVAPANDSSRDRALNTFRQKTIEAAIDSRRASAHKLMSWDFPTSPLMVLGEYDGGNLVAVTDQATTYLCNVRTGDIVFSQAAREAYFNEDASMCVVSNVRGGKLAATGYNTSTGKALFEYASMPADQAPFYMTIWFDTSQDSIYVLNYALARPNWNTHADEYEGTRRTLVGSVAARIDADYSVTEFPEVPEHVIKAIEGVGVPMLSHFSFYDGYVAYGAYEGQQMEGIAGKLYPSKDGARVYGIDGSHLDVYESMGARINELADASRIFLQFSPNGQYAMSLTDEHEYGTIQNYGALSTRLRICDMAGGGEELVNELLYPKSKPLYLCATDHGMTLVVYMDARGHLVLYDVDSRKTVLDAKITNPEYVESLAVSDGGEFIAIGRSTGSGDALTSRVELVSGATARRFAELDCSNFIEPHDGASIFHIELTDKYLFVSGIMNAFVYPLHSALDEGRLSAGSMTYLGERRSGGNGSNPLLQFLVNDKILFFSTSNYGEHSVRRKNLNSVFDLTAGKAIEINDGLTVASYAYDEESGYLVWQGGNEFHVSRLSDDGVVEDEWVVIPSHAEMNLPSSKPVFDGQYLLLENDSATEVYDVQSQKRVMSLGLTQLAIHGGRIYDVSRACPVATDSYDLTMDGEELSELSLRIRTDSSGNVREFTQSELDRFGL